MTSSERDGTEFERTSYNIFAAEAGVVYTLYDPETRAPLVQMVYTAEQAEQLAEEFMLAASAFRMIQEESQHG